MNKRIISIIVSLCLIIGVFAACPADKEAAVSSQPADNVICLFMSAAKVMNGLKTRLKAQPIRI